MDEEEDYVAILTGVEEDTADEDMSSEGGSQWTLSAMSTSVDDEQLKEELKRRYGPYLNSLKQDSLKKKKKGKLPKEATDTLLTWWQSHIKWPYPTVSYR